MTTTEQNKDLIGVLLAEHRALEHVCTELESGTTSPEHRKQLADHLIAELVRHTLAEERFVHPAVRAKLPDGDRVAGRRATEHAEANGVMVEIARLSPADVQFERLVRRLVGWVRTHVDDEERDLLPRLRATCDPDELDDLGDRVLRARRTTPTRPHPSAPDLPPDVTVLDPGPDLVDRVKRGFPSS